MSKLAVGNCPFIMGLLCCVIEVLIMQNTVMVHRNDSQTFVKKKKENPKSGGSA